MSLAQFIFHVLNFGALALFVGVVVTLGARIVFRSHAPARGLWSQIAMNAMLGWLAQLACVVVLGSEGRVLSYAWLLVVIATSQWWGMRGGRTTKRR